MSGRCRCVDCGSVVCCNQSVLQSSCCHSGVSGLLLFLLLVLTDDLQVDGPVLRASFAEVDAAAVFARVRWPQLVDDERAGSASRGRRDRNKLKHVENREDEIPEKCSARRGTQRRVREEQSKQETRAYSEKPANGEPEASN